MLNAQRPTPNEGSGFASFRPVVRSAAPSFLPFGFCGGLPLNCAAAAL